MRRLQRWITENYGVTCWGFCALCDLPESIERPPLVGGYRPDFWAVDIPRTLTVLGEAKSANDIDNLHSRRQLSAYIAHLRQQPRPVLVFSVPWFARPAAVATLELLISEFGAGCVTRYYLAGDSVLRFPR